MVKYRAKIFAKTHSCPLRQNYAASEGIVGLRVAEDYPLYLYVCCYSLFIPGRYSVGLPLSVRVLYLSCVGTWVPVRLTFRVFSGFLFRFFLRRGFVSIFRIIFVIF